MKADDEILVMSMGQFKRVVAETAEILSAAARGHKGRTEKTTGFEPLARLTPAEWTRVATIMIHERIGKVQDDG